MGFNLASAVGGALEGFAMGGPVGAIAGGAAGGAMGGGIVGATGAATNGTLSLSTSSFLAGTEALNEQNLGFQLQLQAQAQQFDEATSEKSELMREQNELRNVAMEQCNGRRRNALDRRTDRWSFAPQAASSLRVS
jgi:hypothetical protein